MQQRQCKFYIDDFIKSVETPEEAIEVSNQVQPLLSRHGIELKKWISNCDAVTEAIPEDLKSISNTKQVKVEPNKEGSSVLGLQWTVTDNSLQVCGGTNKKVEDEENIPSSVFMIQAEEKKAVIQWERFSNFNRLVNTVAYAQ